MIARRDGRAIMLESFVKRKNIFSRNVLSFRY